MMKDTPLSMEILNKGRAMVHSKLAKAYRALEREPRLLKEIEAYRLALAAASIPLPDFAPLRVRAQEAA